MARRSLTENRDYTNFVAEDSSNFCYWHSKEELAPGLQRITLKIRDMCGFGCEGG